MRHGPLSSARNDSSRQRRRGELKVKISLRRESCLKPQGLAVAAFVFVASGMFAQSIAPRPSFAEFEVASIKPSPADALVRCCLVFVTERRLGPPSAQGLTRAADMKCES